MNSILPPQKDDHHKVEGTSEKIQEDIRSYNLEINITEGGEYLDDAIRMKDQPLEQTIELVNEELFENKMKNLSQATESINILNQKKENFMITTEEKIAKPQFDLKGVKNVVLVHGAFADGSSWARVIPLLQAKGYNVIAVQNPLTSLADDVAAAKRAIAQMDGQVLLVAHSYGGMVISEAGNDPKVVGLVYVAALVPEEGQNANDVNAAMPTTGVEKEFRVSPEGFVSLSAKAINENFVPDASQVDRDLIYATQVPLHASAGEQKVQNPAWKTRPSWFIVATEDGVINPDLERFKAKLIKATTLELKSGHVPMISQPKQVADFIIEAAASVQG